jgi:ribosomal-protein-alanine N-acetyltransferase
MLYVQRIYTQRLYLRLFAPTDLDALARINSDPEVIRYIGEGKPVSREQTAARLHAYIEHWRRHGFGLWAVVHKADQALIGFCGLQFLENTPEVEIGYRLAKRYWRLGLATEGASVSLRYGFEALNLERIVAIVQAGHVASQRVLEKIGLNYEKDACYYNTAVRYYVIVRKEYEAEVRGQV